MEQSANKIEAIYTLRDAAEAKARAEVRLDAEASSEARHAFLDAKLALEETTERAINVCHECERVHAQGDEHHRRDRIEGRHDNVVDVNFRSFENTGEGEAAD